ncbi:MAG: Acetyltransferase [Parcubacteria group bacterium GW2011_GWA2_33_14]|nr:MAG: Acetyltransferase [Parcubacteria group bacterium GW2011_GWA2_33_14]
MIFCLAEKNDALQLAQVHKTEISGGFLSSLHIKFYKYFLSHYFFQSFVILLPKIFSSFKKILESFLYPKKEQSLPKAELLTIAIIKKFQGQGLGKLLLDVFLDQMKQRNITVFKVVVGEELINAIKFYEKNNFTFLKNISIHTNAPSRVYCYEIKK